MYLSQRFQAIAIPFRINCSPFAMDHAQGRAFHHHLARAIMHLNFLAGLLPFFEPSIEFEEGPPATPPHESHSHRSLHTFVPLPTHHHPPTLASHGGIPSRLIVNPEPHLRPITAFSSHVSHSIPPHHCHPTADSCTARASPMLPIHTEPLIEPHPEPRPLSTIPTPPPRTTVPVPVRSKQRSRTVEDPQPKKKSRSEEAPASLSTNPHSSTHRGTESAPPPILEYDDSDESDSAYSRRLSTLRANKAMSAPSPWPPWGKTTSKVSPTLAPTPPVAITSTVTLTPNPNDTTLLTKERLETFTVYNLLHMISRYIWTTWDRFLQPSSMDLRWSDNTDDVFALHEEDKLLDLLNFHRPHWTQGQEYGMIGRVLFPNEQVRRFSSPNQPYIMRMSCHEALPNRNMLP